MQRREFFLRLGVAGASLLSTGACVTNSNDRKPDEARKAQPLYEGERRKAVAAFPFERVETNKADAYTTWARLKSENRGVPIVIGGESELGYLAEELMPPPAKFAHMEFAREKARITQDILQVAAAIQHPADWITRSERGKAEAGQRIFELLKTNPNALPGMTAIDSDGTRRTLSPEEVMAQFAAADRPPLGEWPTGHEDLPGDPGLSVATLFGSEPDKVFVVLVPTADWTEVPAYMKWGGWNQCPPPEYHVAALRSWRDRYGAELIGLSHDVMNLRVARRPSSREEALALAREHYAYCNDIVDQGVGTLSALAAGLMRNDWWYFWWD